MDLDDFNLDDEEPQIVQNGKRTVTEELPNAKASKRARNTSIPEDDDLPDLEFDNEETEEPYVPYVVKYRRVLRHIPLDIPYIPVTTESGSRVYLRILQKDSHGRKFDELDDEENNKFLISTEEGSNRKLFSDWDRIKQEARVLKDKFHRTLANVVDSENVIEKLGVRKEIKSEDAYVQESLWVEKYKPRSYLDLLSEEHVNKTLLHWLKLWDKAVFGNDYLSKVKVTKEKYAKLEAKEKEKAEKDKRFQFRQPIPLDEEYDDMGRPKVKVALLHGPPGLGKTTCAHVVAKHAGYNVREMNASDDRSVEMFRKILDDATQSRSEIFQDGRPNCLVIDEIDGAPAATVDVLINLITGKATETGKNKAKKVLKRPVICICNDLFAPSLKELKKHAFVLHFSPVTVASLAERLNEISSREKLHLDQGTIQSLCEKSECDIRSCLSTLQFLKKKRCTPKDALFSQVGMKDKSKGIFAVWQDVFTIPDGKKYYETTDPSKPEARFRSVMKVVQNFGEYEKLQSGVFENYLRVKFKDCYFESIIEGLGWATWFEDIHRSIDQHQNYVLMGYLPIYFVVCHFLYAQRGWVKINYPSAEITARMPKYRSILKSQLSDVAPAVGRYLDPTGMVTDLFPALVSIIQPGTIRPVPTQIWTARERETLKSVVEIMIAYNLCYTQMKHPETGAYNFVLEPDIEELSKFKLLEETASKRPFPYAVKQLVSREIETEKMRRNDSGGEVVTSTEKKNCESPMFKKPNPVAKAVPITVSPSSPKIAQSPASQLTAKDFFGRAIAPSAESTQEMLAQQRRSSGIYFRFKEGYSNAVRRYVKMKDLA